MKFYTVLHLGEFFNCENLICVGSDLFVGFGTFFNRPKTRSEIIEQLYQSTITMPPSYKDMNMNMNMNMNITEQIIASMSKTLSESERKKIKEKIMIPVVITSYREDQSLWLREREQYQQECGSRALCRFIDTSPINDSDHTIALTSNNTVKQKLTPQKKASGFAGAYLSALKKKR